MSELRAKYIVRRSKYSSIRTKLDGHPFDSRAEARRYAELKLLIQAGDIANLELQPSFRIDIKKKHICTYFADFRYLDTITGKTVIEDVKGMKTEVYKLKKKLVEAMYNVTIIEVQA